MPADDRRTVCPETISFAVNCLPASAKLGICSEIVQLATFFQPASLCSTVFLKIIGGTTNALPTSDHRTIFFVKIICLVVLIEPASVECTVIVIIASRAIRHLLHALLNSTVFFRERIIFSVYLLQTSIFSLFFGNIIIPVVPVDPAERDHAGFRIVKIPLTVNCLPASVQRSVFIEPVGSTVDLMDPAFQHCTICFGVVDRTAFFHTKETSLQNTVCIEEIPAGNVVILQNQPTGLFTSVFLNVVPAAVPVQPAEL